MTRRWAIIAIDPGMSSGGLACAIRDGSQLHLQQAASWRNPRQLGDRIDDAMVWAGRQSVPVYVQVEGVFAKVVDDIAGPQPKTRGGRLTRESFKRLGRGKKKGGRVMYLTGLYAVERCAGAWEVAVVRAGYHWCYRERWSEWALRITNCPPRTRGETVNKIMLRRLAVLFPKWDEGFSKTAQEHIRDALGLLDFRDGLLQAGAPYDKPFRVR